MNFLSFTERKEIINKILNHFVDIDNTELLLKLENVDDNKLCTICDLVYLQDESLDFVLSLL